MPIGDETVIKVNDYVRATAEAIAHPERKTWCAADMVGIVETVEAPGRYNVGVFFGEDDAGVFAFFEENELIVVEAQP